MSTAIRPIAPEEFESFARAFGTSFGFEMNLENMEPQRQIFEFDRTLAVLEGEEMVGTAGVFSFDTTVPGASMPTAGVTWVSVKPTHRRRGVLTDLMRRQLDDVHERGEALATLWASESVIYERFGYGMAAEGVELRIDRTRTALAHEPPTCGRARLISRDAALEGWPAVYEQVLRTRPGMNSRHDAWWKNKALPERDISPGGGARFFVEYEEDGRPLGYVRYRVRGGDQDGSPAGTLRIQELIAASDGAYKALWQYLFGVDLIATIETHHRPVDEPLLWMLADPRRLIRRPYDALWARIVDVAPALEGRRYSAEGRIGFDVRDRFCSWNEGRYELVAGPNGATCRRSDAEPDIALDVADLGAVYLGGARLQTLRRAGRVEGEWDALKRADAMFAWDPLPWCPEMF